MLSSPLPLRVGVGIMLADIAQAGGAQQGVGDGVADDVGVGVPDQPARMLDPQPAQDQRPALAQPMRVVTDPHPHVKAPSRRDRGLARSPDHPTSSEDRSVFPADPAIPARLQRCCFPFCRSIPVNLRKKVSRPAAS